MVDKIKSYNITGVGSSVELGKGGSVISSQEGRVSITDSTANAAVIAVDVATQADHAVPYTQFQEISDKKIKYVKTTVNYNDSNVSLGSVPANTYVHSVIVDPTSLVGADSTTNITVGDDSDVDRLFANFDETVQSVDETDHKYVSPTEIKIYVTQGSASSGTAEVVLYYSSRSTL